MRDLFDIDEAYGFSGGEMEAAVGAVQEAAFLLERAYYRAHDHNAECSINRYERARAALAKAALAIAAHKPKDGVPPMTPATEAKIRRLEAD